MLMAGLGVRVHASHETSSKLVHIQSRPTNAGDCLTVQILWPSFWANLAQTVVWAVQRTSYA